MRELSYLSPRSTYMDLGIGEPVAIMVSELPQFMVVYQSVRGTYLHTPGVGELIAMVRDVTIRRRSFY